MKFVELTRPDGTKVPIAPAWVYMIRPPHRNEDGNAVLVIGAREQQVMESVDEARALLESAENGNA